MTRPELPPLRRIFDEHAGYVWRALRHLGVPEADVDDVCQEVFVVVHRRLSAFEGRSTLRTWIYGICLRAASDYRRRAWVRREVPVGDDVDSELEPPQADAVAAREAQRKLLAALESMDADKREVFVLFEIENVSMKEIAALMSCPLQTAYSRLHAARRVVIAALATEPPR
ncbi:MAG: RNA polymerase sigma factor [Polyangiaceae bacterium]|nr:RNA polymerase sigma factor [Polyangiaceae bacterium]